MNDECMNILCIVLTSMLHNTSSCRYSQVFKTWTCIFILKGWGEKLDATKLQITIITIFPCEASATHPILLYPVHSAGPITNSCNALTQKGRALEPLSHPDTPPQSSTHSYLPFPYIHWYPTITSIPTELYILGGGCEQFKVVATVM
jgi:hypothetical protein